MAALEPLTTSGRVQLTWLEHGTWRALQDAMLRGPWHIFHFIGHGSFDEASREGLLILEDEQHQAFPLTASELARLLDNQHDLRLVLLNSCDGARGSSHDIFSSTAATLVLRGIPAVLAMQYEISDAAAKDWRARSTSPWLPACPSKRLLPRRASRSAWPTGARWSGAPRCCTCAPPTAPCSRSTRPPLAKRRPWLPGRPMCRPLPRAVACARCGNSRDIPTGLRRRFLARWPAACLGVRRMAVAGQHRTGLERGGWDAARRAAGASSPGLERGLRA